MKKINLNKKITLLIFLTAVVIIFVAAAIILHHANKPTNQLRTTKNRSSHFITKTKNKEVKKTQDAVSTSNNNRHSSATNKSRKKNNPVKESTNYSEKTDLPDYYGKPLFDLSSYNKKQAVEKLPSYYGTPTSLENSIIHKQDALQHLSTNYGTPPYKALDYMTDPSKAQKLLTFEHNYQPTKQQELLFKVDTDSFFTGSDNQALLHDNQEYDQSAFLQTIINLPVNIHIPGRGNWGNIDFNFTPRINTIWGSDELAQTSREFVKIGRAITETKHYHEIDRSILWIRETWLKISSRTELTTFKIGFFPKQIGLGLILGNHYRSGNPLLTNTQEKMIDQFRPGFELSTTFGDRNYKASVYYSIYKNNATSFDKQVEFTQSQELCECGDGPPFKKADPSRTAFQTTHLLSAELDIPFSLERFADHDIHIKPFIMYNNDKNQIVEFFGDAESQLVSIGTTCHLQSNQFDAHFDIAGNLGYQDVKAWDRNVTEEHARMTMTHLFAKKFDNISPEIQELEQALNLGGEFILSPTFPYPPGKDVSLEFKAGEEFQTNNPSLIVPLPGDSTQTVNLNPRFKNSFSRFRRCYRNDYRGFMTATDLGYSFCNNMKVGMILGYATGDDRPNDTSEKAYLYRLRSDWNDVRQDVDHCYQGFLGVQSLYTGKHVRTLQLLRAHRLNQPLSQVPELTANLFSNLTYGGFGFWYDKEYDKGTLRCNANVVAMGLSHPITFGFDPVIQDIYETFDFKEDQATLQRFEIYDKRLSQYLGVEFNAFLEFFAKNNLTFYSMLSIFIPGSYYKDIAALTNCAGQNIPLKNQFIAKAKDKNGFENAEQTCITLLNNTAVVAYAGIKFDFDSTSLQEAFQSKRKKKVN